MQQKVTSRVNVAVAYGAIFRCLVICSCRVQKKKKKRWCRAKKKKEKRKAQRAKNKIGQEKEERNEEMKKWVTFSDFTIFMTTSDGNISLP